MRLIQQALNTGESPFLFLGCDSKFTMVDLRKPAGVALGFNLTADGCRECVNSYMVMEELKASLPFRRFK